MSDYVIRHKGTPFSLLQQVEQKLSGILKESKDQPNSWLNPEIPVSEEKFLSECLLPLLRDYLKIAEVNPDSQQLINLIQHKNAVQQPNQQVTPWRNHSRHR